MLRLRYELDGESRTVTLTGPEIRLGRSGDNEVVLPDYSVSRRHAALRPDGDSWYIYDLKSTNGVQLNQTDVQRAPVRAGDRLKVGVFELSVEAAGDMTDTPTRAQTPGPTPILPDAPSAQVPPGYNAARYGAPLQQPPPMPSPATIQPEESVLSNATIVRSIKDFSAQYGLEGTAAALTAAATARDDKRKALDEAYATPVFVILMRLARLLITAESVEVVLERVLEIAFETLPVDRGFILLHDESSGELRCELMRIHDRIEHHPQGDVPISTTMLQSVMREQVALLTYDALSDQRLAGTESVRIHQIRAAMCAPLWSGKKIIGVMQVDTPHHAGSFTEGDVDLLTTLANFCAVATERIQNARKVDFERQVRSRLERYHSPGVIEEVMQEESGEGEMRRLKKTEASVLFADIVGFTAYSEDAAPEEVAELMEGYFTHAVEAIFSTGGTLDKFIGDCVMAFFGAPVAMEDHAARAVEAAVRIRESLDEWNEDRDRRGLKPVAIRIGINSGPVVVGDIGSNRRVDYTVLGNTVNVAARLEELVAKPGEIVIGDSTLSQIGDKFPTESLGEIPLKGLSKPIPAYRVLRQS